MKVGISGLAVGNSTGLGRLARISIIALAQAAPDWDIHVFLRSPADLDLLYQECDRRCRSACEQLTVHFPLVPGLNRVLLESWDLPRQFKPLELDCYLGCDFTLPPRRVAQREAVLIPDLLPFSQPATVSWRARWLYRDGIRRSVSRRATLICISAATEAALRQQFPEAGCTRIVYPAVSPVLWRHSQSSPTDHALQVRGSLHALRSLGHYILSVGVSGPRKNTELLVRLYTRMMLEHTYRGSLVLVGGDGRHHTAPRNEHMLAPETVGRTLHERHASAEIHDIGRVSDYDLSQLYSNADLLVSLSIEEGFGYPVLEALVHGTPAFVTAGTSMVEIADRGIVSAPLNNSICFERLKSAVGALDLLRREVRSLDLSSYSVDRLGTDLKEALEFVAN